MSRPASGQRARPTSAHLQKGMKYPRGDVVSYEDVLVAQYLEDLRKAPPYTKGGAISQPSPYMQRLAHSHIVPTPNLPGADSIRPPRRTRPQSATAVSFRPQSGKPRMDPRFIADPDMYDPATPRGAPDQRRKRRPVSAPAYRRPLSATYGSSRPSSAKSTAFSIYSSGAPSTGSRSGFSRRVKPLYKKQTHTIVATAFKNGSRSVFTRVAAPSIKMLLEMCTDRLGLPHAARRVFLDDGTEVFHPAEIPRDSDIYISMGENYKNAFKGVKQQTQQQRTLAWTVNGLAWSAEAQRKPAKSYLSKRFKQLLEPSKRRVLIFKNSQGTEGVEIVADPDRFEDFLVACTQRLELRSYARVLYDWEGREINDLKTAPVLDSCLQTWTTPVLGPLWVSTGEGFSPKGVNDFLVGLIKYTRSKETEAKHYESELRLAKAEHTREQVKIVAILSMSEGEIEETLKIVQKDIEDFNRALKRLKQQMNKLKEMVADEEELGVGYKLQYMGEYDMDHRLVGAKGIRLKVYENGSYEDETTLYFNLAQAAKGLGKDQSKLLARLLDECSSHHVLAQPKANTTMKPVAQKIFDKLGNEITNVYDLEYDQEVWLSFGEPWKNPFTFVLSAQFDKIRAIDIQGQKQATIREQLMSEDYDGNEKPNCWEAVHGVPEAYSWMTVGVDSDLGEKEHIMGLLESGEISVQSDFLRAKDNPDLLLYVEPTVSNKAKKGSKNLWPPDCQQWVIARDNDHSMTIACKFHPWLVLGVSSYPFAGTLGHPLFGPTETRAEGYLVTAQLKTGDRSQMWRFTEDGTIRNEMHQDLLLTYLGSRFGDEDTHVMNENEGVPKGMRNYIAACKPVEGKDAKTQRWAIKQEKMENLGQWKHTQVDNPEWNKRALSWPVNKEGNVNENYDWPMEGFLMPYAPTLKVAEKKASQRRVPLRLMVLKNGVRDVSKAIAVVGPDLGNMRKDVSSNKVDKKNKKNAEDTVTANGMIHCDDELTVLKLEFILFLERCTQLLSLPFAARRIFDETGKEHFSLNFSRDQLVYVSCGEPWSDPNLSKAEQQRRYLLANLGSDVAQIRQFIALRDPKDLVLEAESLNPGAKLIINHSALDAKISAEPKEVVTTAENGEQEGDLPDTLKKTGQTHHEVSHQNAEERYNKRKYSWEREGKQQEGGASTTEATGKRQQQQGRRPASQTLHLQTFVYEEPEGYIASRADSSLVLGVEEVDGNVSQVVLMKRRIDDINQRWIIDKGLVVAKGNTTRVLSVIMPSGVPVDEDGLPLTYIGSEVALQNRKLTQFGRANQRWDFNAELGIIGAFHTNTFDKEVTAANKANVCTYAVMHEEQLDQPGYRVELPTKSGNKVFKVCSSCARAMRGRHKLERIAGNVDFACDMGQSKSLGIKQVGSFQCLNGKVDLRTREAGHTLREWEAQLEKLREELSVRAIANKISAARVPFTIKVLAYKNGQGRIRPGELIIGSSVAGILEQCTHRLSLNQAARRLYTADGFMVLDLEDLVRWAQQNYVSQAKAQLRAQAANKPSELTFGHDALTTRTQMSNLAGSLLVPNPTQQIESDGFIHMWNFYCAKPGKLYLLILTPDGRNKSAFHVEDQVDFDIQQAGEYSVDMTNVSDTPWFGKGMAVKKGCVIGMYWPGESMIPYDVDGKESTELLSLPLKGPPSAKDTLTLKASQQKGTLKFSLNAMIKTSAADEPVMNGNLMDKVDLEESDWEDEEDDNEEEQPPAAPNNDDVDDSEDFAIGYEVLPNRAKLGGVPACMLVPNPTEEVEQDGYVYMWNFYCTKPGKLFVQILRPDTKNLNAFHVEDQADFEIRQAGEYNVDMTNLANTPWFGKGMRVKRGSVIGFYCSGESMIPFDLDETIHQAPFYQELHSPPSIKDTITLKTWQQSGTRKYSLNAFIRPANKVDVPSKKSAAPPSSKKTNEKTKKNKKKKRLRGPHVDTPPTELVLKYPIEVWVSGGEPFIKPEKVERQLVHSMQQREQRAAVSYELEKEKHILRLMQGRRLDEMASGQYKATMNPTHPVLIEGHWQEPTADEQQKHDTVHQLQTHLSDMRSSQKPKTKTCNVNTTSRLYTQPAMKRVLVFPNGESIARAVYIWGETVAQLLDNCTVRLNLRKAGRYLFNMAGNVIADMSEIERDQLLCVSYTKSFQRPKESQQDVEVKANWSRARRQYGPGATDITVQAQKNPGVDVDPFGPSALVGKNSAQAPAAAKTDSA